jgi:predicted flap endonuclease-1-like 5' DNA nuclease
MSKFILLICELSWWMILLSWLLPLLIGYLIGRLTKTSGSIENNDLYTKNYSANSFISNVEQKNSLRLNQRNLELESLLVDCRKSNLDLERKCNELEKAKVNFKSNVSEIKVNALAQSTNNQEKDEVIVIPANDKHFQEEIKSTTLNSDIDYSIFNKLTKTNLQIFEGLGPKMETFLKNNAVNNWEDLSKQDHNIIKQKLEVLDPKYRILDPSSWPIQARMACNKQWSELIQYQKDLSESKSKEGTVASEAKLEKLLVKMGLLKRYKKDDLKAVEGIGPKIEKLLHDNNIKTWIDLKNSNVEVLKSILLKAGERYQLADPTTWPYQAGIANEGKWKELFDYQDTLKGGKIV